MEIAITISITLAVSVPTTFYFTRRYYQNRSNIQAAPILVGGENNNVTVHYTNDQKPQVIEGK